VLIVERCRISSYLVYILKKELTGAKFLLDTLLDEGIWTSRRTGAGATNLRSYLEYKSRQNHLWGKYRRR
jgi:hypothetical protein